LREVSRLDDQRGQTVTKDRRDPRLSNVILAVVGAMKDGTATAGDVAEAALKAADEASLRCNTCGGIVSYHDWTSKGDKP
jgi:hypothetical protein